MNESVFGSWRRWPREDLIGYSDHFDVDLTLEAYRNGVFPMPIGKRMGWWSPMRRAHLPLDGLRVTRSLRKMAARYTTTVDAAFGRVIRACGDPKRPDGWIDRRIVDVYTALHNAGHVHSVETWDDEGRLVGGLYGVRLGGLFAGESMFHDRKHGRDASKVALMRLVADLRASGAILLDVQWATAHLVSLGVVEVPRQGYLRRLEAALERPAGEHRRGSVLGRDLIAELG